MRELRYGLKQTFPIFFTYLFMGVAFGVMMAKAGYGPLWSLASAFFVYAGSLQFVMVPLLQAHTPLLTMAVMAFFINARHIFYGVGMIDRFRTMGWRFPYMVGQNRGFTHHPITTIAMAAYTFYTLTMAAINLVRCRRYNNPVLSAAKAVSLAAALVSMLSLETAMLNAFGSGDDAAFRRVMLAATGGTVCLAVLAMGLYMMARAAKELRRMKKGVLDYDA